VHWVPSNIRPDLTGNTLSDREDDRGGYEALGSLFSLPGLHTHQGLFGKDAIRRRRLGNGLIQAFRGRDCHGMYAPRAVEKSCRHVQEQRNPGPHDGSSC